jgi:prepilin peptidase CpaA
LEWKYIHFSGSTLALPSELIVLTTLCIGLGSATLIDLRERRIPNVVCGAMAAAGVALSASGLGHITLASSLAGLVIGAAMMLPGHILGATGAGDVKLFAAAGTLLGSGRMVPAFLFVAIAGGVLALFVAWRRGRIGRTMELTAGLVGRHGKATVESQTEHNRFAYGPAIAAGCLIAAWIR